jgi:hypothetical protein
MHHVLSLSFQTRENELRQVFEKFGTVKEARVAGQLEISQVAR